MGSGAWFGSFVTPEPVDEYVMQSVREFKEFKVISADSEDLKLKNWMNSLKARRWTKNLQALQMAEG